MLNWHSVNAFLWRTMPILSSLLFFPKLQPDSPFRTSEMCPVASPSFYLFQILSPCALPGILENQYSEKMYVVTFSKQLRFNKELSLTVPYIYDSRLFFCPVSLLAACHSSCLTCVGPEPSHCTRCKKPEEGLQVKLLPGADLPSGECLPHCRAKFYLESTGQCEGTCM